VREVPDAIETPWLFHDTGTLGTEALTPMERLPQARVFVVQLSEDTDPVARLPSGRVEHIESGLRGRFSCREELWIFIEKVLSREDHP